MSSAVVHLAAGAVAGVLPDAALALFGWRRRYLEPSHPLVRLHRALHGPGGLILACVTGAALHLVLDRYGRHSLPRWVEVDQGLANRPPPSPPIVGRQRRSATYEERHPIRHPMAWEVRT